MPDAVYQSNELNQYTAVSQSALGYDPNGNLDHFDDLTTSHSADGRLESVTKSGVQAIYGYDAAGRRTSRHVGGAGTRYLHDGDQVIEEYDDSGQLLRRYVYGPGIDRPIRISTTTGSFYYHFDALGSVVALSDATGALAESHAYSPFGEVNHPSAVGNPYLFTGREYDPESGLYYYRNRYYSPELGRFLEPDPLGYTDGMNLYAYVNQNPVNYVDPMGLIGRVPAYGASAWGAPDATSRLDSGSFVYGLTTSANATVSGIGAHEESFSFGRVLGNDTGFTGQRDITIRTSLSEPAPVFGKPAAGGFDIGVDAAGFAFVGTPRQLINSTVTDASLAVIELKVFHLQGGGAVLGIRGFSIGLGLGLGASSIDGSAVPTSVRITDVPDPLRYR